MKSNIISKLKNKFQDYIIYFQGILIVYKIDKIYFWLNLLSELSTTVRIYINSFLASIIINGVYEKKGFKELIIYAFFVVVANLLLNILLLIINNVLNLRRGIRPDILNKFFNSYSETMDYCHFENAKMRDLRRRISQNIQRGVGITSDRQWKRLISSFFGIITSFSILITLLIPNKVQYSQEIFNFINSPFATILFIMFIIATYINNSFFEKKISKSQQEATIFFSKNGRRITKMRRYTTDTKLAMDLHIFNIENIIEECSKEYLDSTVSRYKDFSKEVLFYSSISKIIDGLFKTCICLFIGLKILSGAIGIGYFVLYLTSVLKLKSSVEQLGHACGRIHGYRKTYDEELSYIKMLNTMSSGNMSIEPTKSLSIEFKNVYFKYPGASDYVLKNINLIIYRNEKIALVGPNGSGKTTFIKLLCRLYDPTEGSILLNGVDIKQYKYDEYLRMISVVFQDFKLFSFPLGQNIAANMFYNKNKVYDVIVKSKLENRYKTFATGMETCLYRNFDDNGIEISGGEAQRIALARALYKNAPIMILDEPTAALDPISESEIYRDFNEITKDKTAIYVSHRLSSCKFCNKIIVFDSGNIIQEGSHENLVKQDGLYNEMWHAQAQHYLN